MASKTISFVAKGDLVEWLEEESEKRMTSMSSTVQQLLAEKYREETGEREQKKITETEDSGDSETTEERESDHGGKEYDFEVIGEYEDEWYEPNSSENNYAIKDGDETYYYKTQRGLANRLESMFG